METIIQLLEIEGLAGQMYVASTEGAGYFAWWNVASDAVKKHWRAEARQKIDAFNKRNSLP